MPQPGSPYQVMSSCMGLELPGLNSQCLGTQILPADTIWRLLVTPYSVRLSQTERNKASDSDTL